MAVIQIADAVVKFDRGPNDLWVLTFEDHVRRERGRETRLVPTGISLAVGPLTRELAEDLAKGILRELSGLVIPQNGSHP